MRTFELVNSDAAQFVQFWSARYRYPNEDLYDGNVGLPLTEERLWRLFGWKNGTINISARKRQSIEAVYLPELQDLPELQTHADGQAYIAHLAGGAIWNIFWLHCINGDLFPIFDQHTYRAMASISQLPAGEIPAARDAKIAAYFDQYLPFLANHFHGQRERDVDRALFTYGRFLKSSYAAPR